MKSMSIKRMLFVVILVGTLGMCLLFGLRVQQTACDKVYILSFRQRDLSFSSIVLSNIKDQGIDITYAQRIYLDVSNGFRSEEIPAFVTNENYAYFTDAYLVKGAFFNEMQIEHKLPLVVANEAAAYQLFGSQECVGETVYLNGVSCEVCGIMAEPEESVARLYIPYSMIESLDISEPLTEQVWCRFTNLAEAALVLGKAGYSLETFQIVQMDSVKGVFWQRFFCPLILMGIYVVFCTWKSVSKKVKRIMQDDSIEKKWVKMGVLQIMGACAGVFLIFKMAQTSWCVPPAYELSGSWKDMLYSIVDFYLLADVDIGNMPFLAHWNLVSGISLVVCLYLFSLFVFCHKPGVLEKKKRGTREGISEVKNI